MTRRLEEAFEGALARKLDFGEWPALVTSTDSTARAGLRLAPGTGRLTGPDKYRILERRRRRAQMAARHLLDALAGGQEGSGQ